MNSVITPNLFPGVSISADLGNGPGIQEVATFSVDVAGPHGKVAVSNAHGTVTGAAGGVLLRPFARLISNAGDSVTTYGEPWNMNSGPVGTRGFCGVGLRRLVGAEGSFRAMLARGAAVLG